MVGCSSSGESGRKDPPGTFLAQPVAALGCDAGKNGVRLVVLTHPTDGSYYVVSRTVQNETLTRGLIIGSPTSYDARRVGDRVDYGMGEINLTTGVLVLSQRWNGLMPTQEPITCEWQPSAMAPQKLYK